MKLRLPILFLTSAGLGSLLGACRHDTEVAPDYRSYFPLEVGSFRSYAVQDSTWTAGKVSVAQYQVREVVTEQFTDAAGQPAYRLTRARRADASQAWADDSVLVVQPLARALLLTRSNVRTVELIYPPVPGKGWNQFAFTVNGQAAAYHQFPDTITNITRQYGPAPVGASYTVPAAGAAPATMYSTTVMVADVPPVYLNNGVYRGSGYQQVFAQGVGPVLRRRYYYQTFIRASNGIENPTPGIVQDGSSRRETLLATGKI